MNLVAAVILTAVIVYVVVGSIRAGRALEQELDRVIEGRER